MRRLVILLALATAAPWVWPQEPQQPSNSTTPPPTPSPSTSTPEQSTPATPAVEGQNPVEPAVLPPPPPVIGNNPGTAPGSVPTNAPAGQMPTLLSNGGNPPQAAEPSEQERRELDNAMTDGRTSPQDLIRVLEAHLRKYPNSLFGPEIKQLLATASAQARDSARLVQYGPGAIADSPNNTLLLDKVSAALLDVGGKENAEKVLGYAKRYEEFVTQVPVAQGSDPVYHQEERDRALQTALLYQSRAKMILGDPNEARRFAALAYIAYPDANAARAWAKALDAMGNSEEAVQRMAEAFAIPDARVKDADRTEDRKHLGEMYKKLHGGSEKGLGDEILAAYDRTSALVSGRAKQLRALDPNWGQTDPMQYTLRALDGGSLKMSSLKGKVLILDFWATWCTPCRAQHPLYEQAKQRFRDRDEVVFLSVNADEDPQPVGPFLDANRWSRLVYYESGLARLWQVNSIPATIVIDKNGRVSSRMDGFIADSFVDQLTNRVQAALDGPLDR